MPALSNKEKRRLPQVAPPPFYNDKETLNDHGNALPQRRMGSHGGLPQGASRNRHGDNETADPWHEWNPGEFQRSYPKSDPRNKDWYAKHKYGRIPGTNLDGWVRRTGPFPSEAKAANAIRKRAGKGKP